MGRTSLHCSMVVFVVPQLLLALPILRTATATTQSVFAAFTRRHFSPLVQAYPNIEASWRSPILSTRGGALPDEEYDEEDYDDEMYDDFGLDDADFNVAEDDFAELNLVDQALAAWEKTPPVTKGYLSASFAAAVLGYLTNKNEFPDIFVLNWKLVVNKMQIWRPFTAFFNFGPIGLVYVLTAHFVWTYMSTLERLNHNRPYDFWIMIAFACISMLVGYGVLGVNAVFLGHNLSQFFVYVWSRYHEGMQVSMFGLFTIQAELLPWAFLAQTFLLEGQPPILDLLGILFGHVYHHLKTTGILRAPQFVVNWYKSDSPLSTAIRDRYKTISSDFEMQEEA